MADRLDVHLYFHFEPSPGVTERLDNILTRLTTGFDHMTQELDTLSAQVASNTSVEQSALVLIRGIADRVAAAATDPAALTALSASLKTSADELAAAVAANTPVV